MQMHFVFLLPSMETYPKTPSAPQEDHSFLHGLSAGEEPHNTLILQLKDEPQQKSHALVGCGFDK